MHLCHDIAYVVLLLTITLSCYQHCATIQDTVRRTIAALPDTMACLEILCARVAPCIVTDSKYVAVVYIFVYVYIVCMRVVD